MLSLFGNRRVGAEAVEHRRRMRVKSQGFSRSMLFTPTFLASLTIGSGTLAQEAGKKFPEGISPSDVYTAVDLLNRSVDVLLQARKIKVPPPQRSLESGLGPFHAYQLQLACIEKLHAFQRSTGMRPIPLVVSTPMKYSPADVKKLTHMMLAEVRKVASTSGVEGLPDNVNKASGKTPTDVAKVTLDLFAKLSALSGQEKTTPSAVYAQIVRAVADAESILKQIDPASRYYVDAPVSEPGRTPGDVFAQCLEVRREINTLREWLGLSTTPVPKISTGRQLQPADVFVQTQIIIAELNLLKMSTDTVSSTPLAIQAEGKTPTDVHQQVAFLKYLIPQVRSLRTMVAQTGGR